MKQLFSILFLLCVLLLASCSKKSSETPVPPKPPKPDPKPEQPADITTITDAAMLNALMDQNIRTQFEAKGKTVVFTLDNKQAQPINAYAIVAYKGTDTLVFSSSINKYDPVTADPGTWIVEGSNDNTSWAKVDERTDVNKTLLSARLFPTWFILSNTANYRYFKFTVKPRSGAELKIADINLATKNPYGDWPGWRSTYMPSVTFTDDASTAVGSQNFNRLVQVKQEYIRDIAFHIAELVYGTETNFKTLKGSSVSSIGITLTTRSDVNGLAWKQDGPNGPLIFYKISELADPKYTNSIYDLDSIRGVLYHELAHAYQLGPKGISYGDADKIAYSEVEGFADLVRIQSGFFPFKDRKRGGSWLSGYSTTGFFLDWLAKKYFPNNPFEFTQKFNESARNVTESKWSWEAGLKYVLRSNYKTVQEHWDEYQAFLRNN